MSAQPPDLLLAIAHKWLACFETHDEGLIAASRVYHS
jgi:hypothetical protein